MDIVTKITKKLTAGIHKLGNAVEYDLSFEDRKAAGGVYVGSVDTVGFDGRKWYWISPNGLKNAFSDEAKFLYALSQEMRSSGKARDIMDKVMAGFGGRTAAWGPTPVENPKVTADTSELKKFIEMLQTEIDADFKKNYPNTPQEMVPQFVAIEGPKYVKIIRQDKSSRSAHAFIDKATGDILKAAGWLVPAKHARGNLFDADGGRGAFHSGAFIKYMKRGIASKKVMDRIAVRLVASPVKQGEVYKLNVSKALQAPWAAPEWARLVKMLNRRSDGWVKVEKVRDTVADVYEANNPAARMLGTVQVPVNALDEE